MSSSKGIREVGFIDCAGGGQVMVDGNYCYIGQMSGPGGTAIIDVSDPKHPKQVSEVQIETGMHSHKVRTANNIMLVNHEIDQWVKTSVPYDDLAQRGGLGIYDVSNPAKPKQIGFWKTKGSGCHRFTFDGRYAYISPTVEGYTNNIVMILDLKNPEKPEEVGRWWMPGQWHAGGETPTWTTTGELAPRCHHPIRMGDRLYVSYWHGGGVILDISDMAKPKQISKIDWSPPFPWPMHSLVPIPFDIYGHKWMLVADEDVLPKENGTKGMPAFLWMVNITDETKPTPVGSFQVEGIDGDPNMPQNTGLHQPVEEIRGTELPCAWFSHGLRVVDFSNPHNLKEVAYYMPDPAPGAKRVSSNDVFQDDRGLIYLIDRIRGLHIVERT